MQSTLHSTIRHLRFGWRGFWGQAFDGATHTGGNWNFPLRQFVAKPLGHRPEINFLERIFTQIADMSAAIVILATTGDRQVGIDGEVVILLARQRGTIISAPGDPRAEFKPPYHHPADKIADAPVKTRLRIADDPRWWRICHKQGCFFSKASRKPVFGKA
jgi:hypothetical protein